MKKTIKHIITFLLMVSIFTTIFAFNVSADTKISVGGGEFTVGQNVSISINISHDAPIMTAQINVSYNSSVLTLKSVSGAESTSGNGTINIVDDNFSTATKDVTTGSYTLNFTAVAAGNSNISANVTVADKNLGKGTSSATGTVTVVTPKPSSNANLSSIKLSSGSLSPAFNAKTTKYDVTVKYSVDTITITGAVADGGATYTGGGTFGLQVGNNSRVLTVTAADGTKKTYTINIKRMTEQETLDAEQAARDANPLLVIIDNVDYTIVNNFESLAIPAGFVQGTAIRKETEIAVLNDQHGEYQLYWLVDANGENGAFYTRDENDIFSRISHINANGKMYIIESLDVEGYVPGTYIKTERLINNQEIMVYNFADEYLKDFCIVKCYVDGARAYYCFDSVEGTMQRAANFDLDIKNANAEPIEQEEQNTGRFAWLTNMSKTGKLVFLIVVFAAVLFIAAAVIIVIKIATSNKEQEEYTSEGNDDFVLSDFSDNNDSAQESELLPPTQETEQTPEMILNQPEDNEEKQDTEE